METLKYILGAVVGAILLGGGFFAGSQMHGSSSLLGSASRAPDVDLSVRTINTTGVGTSTLGAAGTVQYFVFGGIDLAFVQKTLTATSSTVCSMSNPFQATSSPLWANMLVTANGLGTQTVDISTSSTALASSSPALVKKFSIGTGNQASIYWTPGLSSSTPATGVLGTGATYTIGNSPYVMAPTEFLNFSVATGTAGTFSAYYTGSCSALFVKP